MSYWGSSSTGAGTYSKAKNSLIPTYNPAGNSASYVTYSTSNTTATPNVSYPSASSYSKPPGKVTYYTQDWNNIKQAQYKATGRVSTGRGRGGRGGYSGAVQTVHYCETCKITCGTAATYKAHLEGSKHLKKVAKVEQGEEIEPKMPKTGIYKCCLCDINSTSNEAFQAHIKGSKHDKKVQLHKRLGKPIPENVTPLNPVAELSKAEKVGEEFVETKYDATTKRTIFFCSMCNCSFMDATAKEFHIAGRRHRLEFKKKYDKTLKVDMPASKRQKMMQDRGHHGGRGGRGGFRGNSRNESSMLQEDNSSYKEIWEAEQRQLESEWNQYREEERWYRYIDGIKRQEEEHRQWYLQEKVRCERMGLAPPPPPPRPRPPPPPPARDNSRKLLNNHDANLIHQKHSQLQPNKSEIIGLENLMKQVEDTLEIISEDLDEQHMQTEEYKTWKQKTVEEAKKLAKAKEDDPYVKVDAASAMDTTTPDDSTTAPAEDATSEKEAPAEKKAPAPVPETLAPHVPDDDHLVIKSILRIGDLPKHSVMKSKIEGSVAVFCVKKPTEAFFLEIFNMLKMKFADKEETLDLVLANTMDEATIFVKRSEPFTAEVRILITSTVFNEEASSEGKLSDDKGRKFLNPDACRLVLALLRQTKWFESRMSISLIVVLQILKDLSKRIPAWNPLTTWAMELMVERCARTKGYSTQPPQYSPAEVLRRVFELLASGFLCLNGPGLNDPCEKEPVDVLGYLSEQEREDLTASAQYALRLLVYNQLYKILGIAQPAALKNPPALTAPSRLAAAGESKSK